MKKGRLKDKPASLKSLLVSAGCAPQAGRCSRLKSPVVFILNWLEALAGTWRRWEEKSAAPAWPGDDGGLPQGHPGRGVAPACWPRVGSGRVSAVACTGAAAALAWAQLPAITEWIGSSHNSCPSSTFMGTRSDERRCRQRADGDVRRAPIFSLHLFPYRLS